MGFYGGNPLKLMDDIAILQPTLFPSVPRVYNRIYGKIKDQLSKAEGMKKWLVDTAIASKLYYL